MEPTVVDGFSRCRSRFACWNWEYRSNPIRNVVSGSVSHCICYQDISRTARACFRMVLMRFKSEINRKRSEFYQNPSKIDEIHWNPFKIIKMQAKPGFQPDFHFKKVFCVRKHFLDPPDDPRLFLMLRQHLNMHFNHKKHGLAAGSLKNHPGEGRGSDTKKSPKFHPSEAVPAWYKAIF